MSGSNWTLMQLSCWPLEELASAPLLVNTIVPLGDSREYLEVQWHWRSKSVRSYLLGLQTLKTKAQIPIISEG
jgi:hypothetical protein